MSRHAENEAADRDYESALRRAEELAEDGNNIHEVMDLLDDEWLGSSIWPSASATLWHDVELLIDRVKRSAASS